MLTGCAVAVLSVGGDAGGEAPRHAAPDVGAAVQAGRPPTARSVRDDGPSPDPRDVASAARGRPHRISIPALSVQAPVVPLATEGRVLVPPADPTTAGWWRDGAVPGSKHGAAVVTGHTVSTGGGVFDDLDRLVPGDRLSVRTSHGRIEYVVDAAMTIRQGRLADRARRLFGPTGPGRLVLVTCENWNGEVYLSNQVVVARSS